jgi:hypothetical protein
MQQVAGNVNGRKRETGKQEKNSLVKFYVVMDLRKIFYRGGEEEKKGGGEEMFTFL